MNNIKLITLACVLVLLLSACANPLNTHVITIKTALTLLQDVEVSKEDVAASTVPLALIKSGDRPVALIAQAYNEHDKKKWVSQDRAMLVIRNGRVIKTVGFENDLVSMIGPQDPLNGKDTLPNSTWISQLDWASGEYGYLFNASYTIENDTISIYDKEFSTVKVVETVGYQNVSSFLSSDEQWLNYYWFETNSGQLLKSSQQSAPFSDRFEITYVSNAVDLM